jgi:hypothetical protein
MFYCWQCDRPIVEWEKCPEPECPHSYAREGKWEVLFGEGPYPESGGKVKLPDVE